MRRAMRASTPIIVALALALTSMLGGCTEPAAIPAVRQAAAELPAGVLQDGLVSASAQHQLLGVMRELSADGLTLGERQQGDVHLMFVEVPLRDFRPVLLASPQTGVSALDVLNEGKHVAVIGSGFVSELHALSPVGLLQIEGQVLSEVQRHGYTRILGFNDYGVGVVGHRDFQRGLFHSALQAGPGVVENGRLDISPRDLERTPYFRSLVGSCEDQLLLVSSLKPTHLYSAGQMIVEYAKERELVCDEVVNLAGDRETVLGLRGADGRIAFNGNPRTSKVSLIAIERR